MTSSFQPEGGATAGCHSPTIAEGINGFNLEEARARTALLLRLTHDLGRPVPVEELAAEVGGWFQMAAILQTLIGQNQRSDAAFIIERIDDGRAVRLKRAAQDIGFAGMI